MRVLKCNVFLLYFYLYIGLSSCRSRDCTMSECRKEGIMTWKYKCTLYILIFRFSYILQYYLGNILPFTWKPLNDQASQYTCNMFVQYRNIQSKHIYDQHITGFSRSNSVVIARGYSKHTGANLQFHIIWIKIRDKDKRGVCLICMKLAVIIL